MIYNNNTKFELCRYWQKLEEKGFDPSVELNKSLEIFDIVFKFNNRLIIHILKTCFILLFKFQNFLKNLVILKIVLNLDIHR